MKALPAMTHPMNTVSLDIDPLPMEDGDTKWSSISLPDKARRWAFVCCSLFNQQVTPGLLNDCAEEDEDGPTEADLHKHVNLPFACRVPRESYEDHRS
jgi:hypothetical protein